MYCQHCGQEISVGAKFCQKCGGQQDEISTFTQQTNRIACPKCNSNNVTVQLTQENVGSKTVTRTTVRVRKSKHGLFWWLFIGWWWWMFDLIIWVFLFIPRFLYHITKKRKVAFEKSRSNTKNKIQYKKHCICQNCGYTWFAGKGIDSNGNIISGLLR